MKRRILLAALVVISGCAIYSRPNTPETLSAGESWCSSTDKAVCDRLNKVVGEMNSPAMLARICAAGAMTGACK
jgi:hypothetical protein